MSSFLELSRTDCPPLHTFTDTGCYSDSISARSIPNGIHADEWTVVSCLNAVQAAGYSMGGIIYGGECWVRLSLPRPPLCRAGADFSFFLLSRRAPTLSPRRLKLSTPQSVAGSATTRTTSAEVRFPLHFPSTAVVVFWHFAHDFVPSQANAVSTSTRSRRRRSRLACFASAGATAPTELHLASTTPLPLPSHQSPSPFVFLPSA